MTTTLQPAQGTIADRWYLVNARGQTLGRLAVNVARVLRGKHRVEYSPHVNCGDHVIVINAKDIVVTGKKRTDKEYDRYSGYPGGRRVRRYEEAVVIDPTFPLRHAVQGMLQHNTLGALQAKRLRIYTGDVHGHTAQKPIAVSFGELGEVIEAQ